MSDLTTPSECASDLVLDRALGGELASSSLDALRAHLTGCAHCHARWRHVAEERERFLATAPSFDTLAARVEARRDARVEARREPRGTVHPALLLSTAVAAAATVLIVQRAGLSPSDAVVRSPAADAAPSTRSKGRPHLGFFIKRGVLVTPGHDGAEVHPGDRLRFTYTSATPRYFALFNLDAHGARTYFPSEGGAVRVRAGSEVPLDFGVELDAELGGERVFGVFCAAPFEPDAIRRTLGELHELTAPEACVVDVLSLRKEPP